MSGRPWGSSREASPGTSRSRGRLCILKINVPIELPPVGIITLRGRSQTPASQLLMECLRKVAPPR